MWTCAIILQQTPCYYLLLSLSVKVWVSLHRLLWISWANNSSIWFLLYGNVGLWPAGLFRLVETIWSCLKDPRNSFCQAGIECPGYLPPRRKKGSSKDGISLLGGDEYFIILLTMFWMSWAIWEPRARKLQNICTDVCIHMYNVCDCKRNAFQVQLELCSCLSTAESICAT